MAYFYTDIDTIDEYAFDTGNTAWTNLENDQKKFILDIATSDLEQIHGQPRQADVPAFYGDYDMSIACRYQALWVSMTLGERLADRKSDTLTKTGSSFSDGILSTTPKGSPTFDYRAKIIVGDVMRSNGVFNSSASTYRRG